MNSCEALQVLDGIRDVEFECTIQEDGVLNMLNIIGSGKSLMELTRIIVRDFGYDMSKAVRAARLWMTYVV